MSLKVIKLLWLSGKVGAAALETAVVFIFIAIIGPIVLLFFMLQRDYLIM